MEMVQTDVIVIGASLAGTTAAALFACEGLSALLVDRIRDGAAFKKQCTHFIRAGATPVLERLGVIDAMERAGAAQRPAGLDAGRLGAPGDRRRARRGRPSYPRLHATP
jgi:2-polyprenyl-6-methoxyphenol hydroxylase-like FAD-dependent oxidoreductase